MAVPHKSCHDPEMPIEPFPSGSDDATQGPKLRIRSVAGSQFPLQVIQRNGLPEVSLTVFGTEMLTMLSSGSAYGYLREVVLFANWAGEDNVSTTHQWRVMGEPREVRNLIREYLMKVGECRIVRRPDTLGIRVSYVNTTNGTRINVRLLLAALKRLYEILADRGLYPFPNPLIDGEATSAITDFRRGQRTIVQEVLGRLPMPLSSGVDAPPANLRLSANYFRLVNREWQPQSIDDPEFPGRIYNAGCEYGWSLREICVARTLLESGARISEVFDLTAADWAVSGFRNQFSASNKGSFDQRVKVLQISNPTAKLYRRYFDECRPATAAERITVAKLGRIQRQDPQKLAGIPIFLTARRTPMTARLFRDHYWKPALTAAGIEADPHTCRHWFVTNALRHIEETAEGESDLVRRKQELIQYMAWRSGERTMNAYEHVQRGRSFALRMHAIHREMEKRERHTAEALARGGDVPIAPTEQPFNHELAFLLGDDHDD